MCVFMKGVTEIVGETKCKPRKTVCGIELMPYFTSKCPFLHTDLWYLDDLLWDCIFVCKNNINAPFITERERERERERGELISRCRDAAT